MVISSKNLAQKLQASISCLHVLYNGEMDVEVQVMKTAKNGAKRATTQILHQNKPCRISRVRQPLTQINSAGVAPINFEMRLFCDPGIIVPAGSKITVNQHGEESVWKSSSQPKLYHTHQEIEIERWGGWA